MEKPNRKIQNDESKGPIIYNFDSRFLSRHLNNTVSSYLGRCLFLRNHFLSFLMLEVINFCVLNLMV